MKKKRYIYPFLCFILVIIIIHLYCVKRSRKKVESPQKLSLSQKEYLQKVPAPVIKIKRKMILIPEEEDENSAFFPHITLAGIVYDQETRNPVAGAGIFRFEDLYQTFLESEASLEDVILKSATSRGDGRFFLSVPLNNDFSILVKKEGYAAQIVKVQKDFNRGCLLEVFLEKGFSLKGVVIDAETKQPVWGAFLFRPACISGEKIIPKSYPLSTETDRNGNFILEGLKEGVYNVAVKAAGYEPFVATLKTEEQETIAIQLGGISFSGKVLTRLTKTPAIDKEFSLTSDIRIPFVSRTDEQGRFSIYGIKPGKATFRIRWNKDAPLSWCGFVNIPSQSLEENVLYCFEPVRVKGKVINSKDKTPVKEGFLDIGMTGSSYTITTIKSDGSFESNEVIVDNFLLLSYSIPGFIYLDPDLNSYSFSPDRMVLSVKTLEELKKLEDLVLVVDPAIRIRGSVIDKETGAPVSKAIINYSESLNDSFFRKVACDESGKFLLDLPITMTEKLISITHSNYGVTTRKITFSQERTTQTITIKMDTPLTLSGYIGDETKSPVQNAKITAFLQPHVFNPNLRIPVCKSLSSSDGLFSMNPVQPGDYMMTISAKGFKSIKEKISVPPGDIDISLSPSTLLKGKVVDDKGTPLPKIKIVATVPSNRAFVSVEFTDDQGEFALDNLPEKGEVSLVFWRGIWSFYRQNLELPFNEELLITLPRLGGIRGIVRDPDTDKVVTTFSHVLTSKEYNDNTLRHIMEFTPGGGFIINNLFIGRYELMVKTLERQGEVGDIEITPGVITDLGEILLDKQLEKCRLKVVTLDAESGEPLAGCRIKFQILRRDSFILARNCPQGISDPNGEWIADGLDPGEHYVSAESTEHPFVCRKILLAPEEENHLEIRLEKGCIFNGKVVDRSSGEPVEEAQIKVYVPGHFLSMATGREGRFQVKNLDCKKEVMLVISAEGKSATKIKIIPEEEQGELIIELDEGHYVAGKVLDEDRIPLEEVHLFITNPDGSEGRGLSDNEGNFKLENLSDNPMVYIRAWKNGYQKIRKKIEIDTDDVELIMESLPMMQFKVVYEDGNPVTLPFDVYLIRGYQRALLKSFQNSQGVFNLGNLSPGKYTFEIRVKNSFGSQKEFVVNEEAESRTEIIVVTPFCRLNGTVVDEKNQPVSDASVFVFCGSSDIQNQSWRDDFGSISVTTDEDGNFSMDLCSGFYNIIVKHPDYCASRKELRIDYPQPLQELIVLKQNETKILEGYVYFRKSLAPAAGCEINIQRSSSTYRESTVADDKGYYTFQNILPGSYTLSVSYNKGARITRNINVKPEEVYSVFIDLPDPVNVSFRFMKGSKPLAGMYISISSSHEFERFNFFGKTDYRGVLDSSLFEGEFYLRSGDSAFLKNIIITEEDEGKEFVFDFPCSLEVNLFDAEDNAPITVETLVYLNRDGRGSSKRDQTNSRGKVIFPNLPPGIYEITIPAFGDYKAQTLEGIEITEEEQNVYITVPLY